MNSLKTCLASGVLSFGDDFDKVAEIVTLFGPKVAKSQYCNWFDNPNSKDERIFILSEEGGYGWRNEREFGSKLDVRHWNEVVSVKEYNEETEKSIERIDDELSHPIMRLVFWRESRYGVEWYKFYGVFSVDAEATRKTLDSETPCVVYRKIADQYEGLKAATLRVAA